VGLNGTPVEIGYNGHIQVLYLTIHELPFTRVSAVRFPSGAEGNIFHTTRIYYTVYVFISIKLDKIKPNLKKNTFSKLSWPELELSHSQSLPCPSTTTPYFLLSIVVWRIVFSRLNIFIISLCLARYGASEAVYPCNVVEKIHEYFRSKMRQYL